MTKGRIAPLPYTLRYLFLKFLLLLGLSTTAIAKTTETFPFEGDKELGKRREAWELDETLHWKIVAGDDALESGLPSLAKHFYRQVLQSSDGGPDLRRTVELRLISALISEGSFEAAQEVLEGTAVPVHNSEFGLRAALIALGRNQLHKAASHLQTVNPDQLSPSDLPWYALVKGLLAERQGRYEQADAFLKKVRGKGQQSSQRAQIEAFIARNQLLKGQANEDLVRSLKHQWERFAGQAAGHHLTREYAIALEWLGRRGEALTVIRKHLGRLPEKEHLQRDPFLLLAGLIASPESAEGSRSLQQLIRHGRDPDLQRAALYLLAEKGIERTNPSTFETFLTELIEMPPPPHPLLDELLYFKAYLLSNNKRLDEARQLLDGENGLIQRFPDSSFKDKALLLLASIAWQREEPRYRTAADYLNRLRSIVPASRRRALLGVLAADCYFLNGDYENAAEAYSTALEEQPMAPRNGHLLSQLVLSEIKAGRFEKATSALDRTIIPLSTSARWRAEWNLLKALKDKGEAAKALERIEHLLSLSEKETLTFELRVRLHWLQAQLWKETGQFLKIPMLADALLALLADVPATTLSERQASAIAAHTLLMKAEALISNETTRTAGIEILQNLRQRYSTTEPAAQAYLIEARYWASVDRLVDAQQLLVQLADTYPESPLAPIALYEAALSADMRGLATTYQESIELLERLSTNYPKSPLVFYARLKQGDLLRKLNKFGDARQIYESLFQQYPDHPERSAAELYRADCLLAQVAKDASLLSEAAAAFERLFDLPHLPVDLRVEAAWEWASTLVRRKAFSRAEEVYWEFISRFLKDDTVAPKLGSSGRYWMARIILDLAGLMEEQGNESAARKVYDLIPTYGLPGQSLVKAKFESP